MHRPDAVTHTLSSTQDLDMNKDGTVTPMEFKEKMEQQKNYTT